MSDEQPEKVLSPVEFILNAWDEDAVMDPTEPALALMKIPKLHAKYLRYLTENNMRAKKIEQDLIELRREKFSYYSGRMSQEELEDKGIKPFKFVLKAELKDYVESDTEVVKMARKKNFYDEAVSCCNSILKELNSRTYQLRSFIDWERFVRGQ